MATRFSSHAIQSQGCQQAWRKMPSCPFIKGLMGCCLPGNGAYFHTIKSFRCPFPQSPFFLKGQDFPPRHLAALPQIIRPYQHTHKGYTHILSCSVSLRDRHCSHTYILPVLYFMYKLVFLLNKVCSVYLMKL